MRNFTGRSGCGKSVSMRMPEGVKGSLGKKATHKQVSCSGERGPERDMADGTPCSAAWCRESIYCCALT